MIRKSVIRPFNAFSRRATALAKRIHAAYVTVLCSGDPDKAWSKKSEEYRIRLCLVAEEMLKRKRGRK